MGTVMIIQFNKTNLAHGHAYGCRRCTIVGYNWFHSANYIPPAATILIRVQLYCAYVIYYGRHVRVARRMEK